LNGDINSITAFEPDVIRIQIKTFPTIREEFTSPDKAIITHTDVVAVDKIFSVSTGRIEANDTMYRYMLLLENQSGQLQYANAYPQIFLESEDGSSFFYSFGKVAVSLLKNAQVKYELSSE
jgi:hypothetical protein